MVQPKCAICGGDAGNVIYLGFPMRLCLDGECSAVTGLWSFVLRWFPICTCDDNGNPCIAFMPYTCSYLHALWVWLAGIRDA